MIEMDRQPGKDNSLKQKLFLLGKIIVTVGLCVFIVRQGDWANVGQMLMGTSPLLMGLVFAGMLLNVTISAYKWQVLLSIHGISAGFWQLQRYYFTSVFFNNFLPSNIGGDAYRIYKTLDNERSATHAVVAVVTERVTGIWALVAFGAAGALILYGQNEARPPWLMTALSALAAFTLLPPLFVLFSKRTVHWALGLRKFPQKLKQVLTLFDDYRRQRSKSLLIIMISFGFHFFTLCWMTVLCYAAGYFASFPKLALGTAVSNLAAMLPVSINGIGLYDGSFIFVMGDLGMPYDSALVTMLTIRAFLIPLSLIGGWFYLGDKRAGSRLSRAIERKTP